MNDAFWVRALRWLGTTPRGACLSALKTAPFRSSPSADEELKKTHQHMQQKRSDKCFLLSRVSGFSRYSGDGENIHRFRRNKPLEREQDVGTSYTACGVLYPSTHWVYSSWCKINISFCIYCNKFPFFKVEQEVMGLFPGEYEIIHLFLIALNAMQDALDKIAC